MKKKDASPAPGKPAAAALAEPHANARAEQAAATQALVAAMPHNPHKRLDTGRANAVAPPQGATTKRQLAHGRCQHLE